MAALLLSADLQIAPTVRQVSRNGVELVLDARAFDLLVYVVEQAPRTVGKEELVERVWRRPVTDNAIWYTVHKLRKALADHPDHPRYLRTVHGQGLAWMPSVERSTEATANAAPISAPAAPSAASELTSAGDIDASTPVPSVARGPRSLRGWWLIGALAVTTGLAILAVWQLRPPAVPALNVQAEASAVRLRVMPVTIADEQMSWARVGLMALMVDELRRLGVEVVEPTTSVALGDPEPSATVLHAALSEVGALSVLKLELRMADARIRHEQLSGQTPAALAVDAARVVGRWLRPQVPTAPAGLAGFAADAYAWGLEALLRGDAARAEEHFAVCREHAPHYGPVHLRSAEAALLLGELDAMASHLALYLQLDRSPTALAEASLLNGERARRRGALAEAATHYDAVRDAAGARLDQRSRAEHGRAIVLAEQGDLAAAVDAFEAALALSREAADPVRELRDLNGLATVAARSGRLAAAETRYLEVLELARALGQRRDQGVALRNLAAVASARGYFQRASERLELAFVQAEQIGDREGQIIVLSNIGTLLTEFAAYDEVDAVLAHAEALARAVGAETFVPDLRAVQAEARARAGDAEAALRLASEARDAFVGQGRRGLALREARRALEVSIALGPGAMAAALAACQGLASNALDCPVTETAPALAELRAALQAAEADGDERRARAAMLALAEQLVATSSDDQWSEFAGQFATGAREDPKWWRLLASRDHAGRQRAVDELTRLQATPAISRWRQRFARARPVAEPSPAPDL